MMTGGGGSSSSHHRSSARNNPSSSSSNRKSRWDSTPSGTPANKSNHPSSDQKHSKPSSNANPSPKTKPGPSPRINNAANTPPSVSAFPFPEHDAPPPHPTYGFHMLHRHTIYLADGSARTYFALPPDYQDFPPRPPLPPHLSGMGFVNQSQKRKYGEEEFNGSANPNGKVYTLGTSNRGPSGMGSPFRRDGDEMRAGKYMRTGGGGNSVNGGVPRKHGVEVDENGVKKAFLNFVKVLNENEAEKKRYLEDGKQGRLHCAACGRTFPDMHALIMHTYNPDTDLRVDHLGLHRALCVMMGWNYSKPPDNSKAYRILPAGEAAKNQDDLIMWPPMVIIHNTVTGKSKDGRVEGLGNKVMDNKIRELGIIGGKSKSVYGRDGHLGVTLVRFGGDQTGLKDAMRLAEHFEKENHGRKAWERVQPVTLGKDDEKNPNLVKMDRNGEKQRILYGYLGTVADLCKVDYVAKKKASIESLSYWLA